MVQFTARRAFRVATLCSQQGAPVIALFWELCTPTGFGVGLLFRETRLR